jgi:hypothetical protein
MIIMAFLCGAILGGGFVLIGAAAMIYGFGVTSESIKELLFGR